MNRIYEVEEGRPVWKLRPTQLVLTLVGLTLAAAVAFMLAVSGPIASAIGGAIGLGDVAQTIWSIARWPVVLMFVTLAVATLYYAAPNVKQPKFRWISVGAGVAILAWILASVLFGFYVGNFGSYNKTYGALAGVVVFLLWLWITNLALLSVPNWTPNSSVHGNCRQASSPNAICNCPLATAGSARKTRPKTNATSNKAARYGNPAVSEQPSDIWHPSGCFVRGRTRLARARQMRCARR